MAIKSPSGTSQGVATTPRTPRIGVAALFPAELKKAYRKKSLQWHPDRQASGTPEHKYRAHLMFQRISAAHDELQESASRPRYATYWSEESEPEESQSDEEDLYESTPAWTRYFDRAKARS